MNCHAELEKNGLANQRTAWIKRPKVNSSSDADLAMAAADAIECLTTVPIETINVTAQNGWLHLRGTVACEHQRITLEQVTRRLPGVRGVIDSLGVQALPAQRQAQRYFANQMVVLPGACDPRFL